MKLNTLDRILEESSSCTSLQKPSFVTLRKSTFGYKNDSLQNVQVQINTVGNKTFNFMLFMHTGSLKELTEIF